MALVSEVLTSDSMRKVVAEEGLEARNLLNWNVIVSDKISLEVPKTSKKPPTSPRPQSASPKPPLASKDGEAELRATDRCSSLGRPKTRLRSSSAGRNPDKCVRARYWAFLFENLYRAVDEIYQTCEVDESIVESKEAIMMLENYCKEFQALIQWLNISKNYEVTPPRNRPTSLTWEVRKSLPTKGLLRNIFLDKLGASGCGARRKLDLQGIACLQSTAVQTDFEEEPIQKTICTDEGFTEQIVKNVSVPDDTSLSPIHDAVMNQNTSNNVNKTVITELNTEAVESVPTNKTILNSCADSVDSLHNSNETEKTLLETVDGVVVPKFEVEFLGRDELHDVESVNHNIETKNVDKDDCSNVTSECNIKITVPNDSVVETSLSTSESIGNNEKIDSLIVESGISHVSEDLIEGGEVDSVKHNELPGGSKNSLDANKLKHLDKDFPQTVSTDNISISNENTEGKTTTCQMSKSSQTDSVKIQVNAVDEKKIDATSDRNEQKKNQRVSTLSSKTSKPQTHSHFSIPATKNAPTKVAPSITRYTKTNPTSVSQQRRLRTDATIRNANEVKASNLTVLPSEKTVFRVSNSAPNIRRVFHMSSTLPKGTVDKPVNQHNAYALTRHSRPSQHHLGKDLPNAAVKSGSNTSLNSSCKMKKSSTVPNCDSNLDNEEDSDGWETVRGRTRCKNSPAKKIQSSTGAYDRAVAAKLNQSKMGGFPYTCTSNSQAVQKKPSKPMNVALKVTQPVGHACDNKPIDIESIPKSVDKVSDQKTGYKKVSKENIKPEAARKVVPLKQGQNIIKNTKNNSIQVTKQICNSLKSEISLAVAPKVSHIERQLSNISKKSDKAVNPKSNLRRVCSSSTFEMKRKTDLVKNSGDLPQFNEVNVKILASDNVDNSKKEHLVNYPAEPDDVMVEGKSSEHAIMDRIELQSNVENISLPEKSVPHSKNDVAVESEKQYSEVLQANDNSNDSGLRTMPDDQGNLASHDGLNDEQTLEMCEKMMREEAQEHISELGLSWGDQMDLLDMELRTPGRALQMHEKLSSPFRKRTLAETIRRQEEKQLKAQEQREKFLEEKAQRFKDIQKKVEEMKAFNEKRQEQQRISLEQRLQRAEEKRKKELEKIIKKAHDEEEKVNEIAFINSLEAQNKRHDLISKEKDHEARLQDIQGERQRKLEEKAAKEAAAEERRKILEAERQARLLEMQEKRKQRDLKIEQQLLEKEKERHEIANQKARERELRISALNAAQQATVEELQKKIQMKQEESARRHEENIEQIRQKAFELSVRRYSSNNDDAPKLVPYETKKICTICNVLIGSEVYLLSHLRGKKHQEMIFDRHQGHDPSTEELELYNLKHIVDASTDHLDPNIALDKERLKALKKRCKKLRQRMANRGLEFEKTFDSKPVTVTSKRKQKMVKLIGEIKKYASCTEKGPWDTNSVSVLERIYTELDQLFSKCLASEKVDFRSLGGVGIFMDVLLKVATPISNNNTLVPSKVIVQSCKVAQSIFKDCYENSIFVLLSNKIGIALDALNQRLRVLIPDNFSQLVGNSSSIPGFPPVDEVAGELMCFLGVVLDYLAKKKVNDLTFWDAVTRDLPENQEEEFQLRINDIVSYVVSIGIVDRLSQYFNSIRGAVDSEPSVATFLLHSMSFLMALVKLSSDSYTCLFERKKAEDPTQLLATLKVTDLVGAVSLLYCILLHGGSPSLGETPPPQLPDHTVFLTLAALRLLNHSAVLNLHIVQTILGSEGLSLQLRHITNYLLWYCRHWKAPDLLHEIILLIGYFTVLNADNQLIIQVGQRPSVLKQLSTLPFQYFSNRQLTDILFPTLISCCFNSDSNKAVLQHEMSIELLSHYVEGYLLDLYNITQVKNDPNIRWRLHSRFPKCKWTAAKLYFAKPTE